MTIGQRVGQKRKELGLSQEALGEQLGVSRQSIYKWESDSALPEIDKLIALSRLFGVSVGWLLGVEEPPRADGAEDADADAGSAVPETGELTETQLKMVEEIVARYTAALPQPPSRRRRKWLKAAVIAAALCLVGGLYSLSKQLDRMDQQYGTLQNNITRVESTVNSQIGSISSRVEEILKAQNSLTADYGAEPVSADLAQNQVTFSVRAVPKTYTNGMEVEFTAESGGTVSTEAGEAADDGSYTALLTCPLSDSITISAVFVQADGTRSTQLLEQFSDFYSGSLQSVELMNYGSGDLLGLAADENGRLTLPEDLYLTVQPAHLSYESLPELLGQSLEIRSVRVGLFLDKTLIAWLDPCEKPENFHGDYEKQSFYHLPGGVQVTMENNGSQELCFAAVVTDEYGREAVYSDIPYILQNGWLTWPDYSDLSDRTPDIWHYDS